MQIIFMHCREKNRNNYFHFDNVDWKKVNENCEKQKFLLLPTERTIFEEKNQTARWKKLHVRVLLP